MTILSEELGELIGQGETSAVEFKSADVRPESLAREMVALSNTLGGTILVGIDDEGRIGGMDKPDFDQWVANIARHNVSPAVAPDISVVRVDERNIGVVTIPKGISKPYQTIDGKFWIRVGSKNRNATKEELSRLFQQAGLVHYDLSPVESSEISDLDDQRLADYWQTYYEIPFLELNETERRKILINSDILAPLENGFAPSVGGLLIFGKYPQRRMPQSAIVFAVFGGVEITDEVIDKKEITGPLPDLIANTAGLVKLFSKTEIEIEDLQRNETHRIPPKVIREALVNAVCHRDYSLVNRKTTVYLFQDRLEVTSPGRIANTLTVEKIRYGNSAPRNHFLLKYLNNMRFVDGLGRGVPMMIKEMGERVEFEEIGELFRVRLYF